MRCNVEHAREMLRRNPAFNSADKYEVAGLVRTVLSHDTCSQVTPKLISDLSFSHTYETVGTRRSKSQYVMCLAILLNQQLDCIEVGQIKACHREVTCPKPSIPFTPSIPETGSPSSPLSTPANSGACLQMAQIIATFSYSCDSPNSNTTAQRP
jgi:hypothetical protein